MFSSPKTKPKPSPEKKKERRIANATDPAQKQPSTEKLSPPDDRGNSAIPIEILIRSEHRVDRSNVGWSYRCAGVNVERAIAIVLNLANQLVASAVVRSDVFAVRWLAALLLCEFMAVQRRNNLSIEALQIELVRKVFKSQHRIQKVLLFTPLAFELVRDGFFDSLELRAEGEIAFFKTVNVTVPKAALAEAWIWKKKVDLAEPSPPAKPTSAQNNNSAFVPKP
jgi:hypothetical protein